MSSLQKFKFLATQCAVAGSPTRSPTTSPVIHIRRRKTLRMLLSRSGSGAGRRLPRREEDDPPDRQKQSPEKRKEVSLSHKLKDLLVASPPPLEERNEREVRDGFLPATTGCVGGGSGGVAGRRSGTRGLRPLSATFRQRLLRRPFRPVLVAIPEYE